MNTDIYNAGYTVWTDFLFQGMFAATAATIVSGAVAGRIKLLPFLVFSTITACCHLMNWLEAMVLVGAVSGVLVYFAVLMFDKIGVDDPVGATSSEPTSRAITRARYSCSPLAISRQPEARSQKPIGNVHDSQVTE